MPRLSDFPTSGPVPFHCINRALLTLGTGREGCSEAFTKETKMGQGLDIGPHSWFPEVAQAGERFPWSI